VGGARPIARASLLAAGVTALACAVVPRAERISALERGLGEQRALVRELLARTEWLEAGRGSAEPTPAEGSFPHYQPMVVRLPALPDGAEGSLRAMLAATLEARSAAAFEYRGAEGTRAFGPPWPDERFEGVPAPVLYAAAGTATAGHRGAEWDLRLPSSAGRTYWVTVQNELDERITVAATTSPAPAVSSAPVDAPALGARHGVGAIERWRDAELDSLGEALALLSPAEIGVIRGVPFRRARAAPGQDATAAERHCGRFHAERALRWIEIYDCAFENDEHSFVGTPERPLRPSVRVVLHEIGHAVSFAALTDLVARVLSGHEQVTSLVSEFNRLGRRVHPEELERFEAMRSGFEEINAGFTQVTRVLAAPDQVQTPVIRAFALVPGARSGLTPYGRRSPVEAFAEAFSLYRADPDACRRISPEVYEFFASGRHLAPD
jgi:hypothetical protein